VQDIIGNGKTKESLQKESETMRYQTVLAKLWFPYTECRTPCGTFMLALKRLADMIIGFGRGLGT
jgi:hypothetical protein